MKKASNISRVMEIANTFPDGFTTTDVREKIKGINLSSMHALMWNLKKKGILSHDKESGVYKLVNAPTANVSTGVDKKKKLGRPRKAQAAAQTPDLNQYTRQSVNEAALMIRNNELNHKLEDALAIIRYLEDKLFKAIQFDARNGRNS